MNKRICADIIGAATRPPLATNVQDMIIRLVILFGLCPFMMKAQESNPVIESDTAYDDMRHAPCLVLHKRQNGDFYVTSYKSGKALSRDISFQGGHKMLERLLREAYYADISTECVMLHVPFIIVFNRHLRIKSVCILKCPPASLVDCSQIYKLLKRHLKKTRGKWTASSADAESYYYFGRLILL